jgi:DNA (cytosine-5)-methyltransferase 1
VPYNAIDLFCGCGGVTQGLKMAGFNVLLGVEKSLAPATVYRANHPEVRLFESDITKLPLEEVATACEGHTIHLLAGCPPCQGFSAIRCHNRRKPIDDPRNTLISEYFKYVEWFSPYIFIFENVPAIQNYPLFIEIRDRLVALNYELDYRVVNVANYGVPQRRKRFVMIGSKIGRIQIPDGDDRVLTVRDVIGNLVVPADSDDYAHTIVAHHIPRVLDMIRLVPHDGGSRTDLPDKYTLECHKKDGIGFKDVYGRLRWNDVSSTITGGCLNPSKGRFLHPEQDRSITAREAAMLQTFPRDYVFPLGVSKTDIALMIGNALPPQFAYRQAEHILVELERGGIT